MTNSFTHEASSFFYINTVDLFCISIPNLLKPHISLVLFFHQSLFNFNSLKYIVSFASNCQVCFWIYVASSNIMVLTEKFDVLRGRLLGNRNDFHWQVGGQINH